MISFIIKNIKLHSFLLRQFDDFIIDLNLGRFLNQFLNDGLILPVLDPGLARYRHLDMLDINREVEHVSLAD